MNESSPLRGLLYAIVPSLSLWAVIGVCVLFPLVALVVAVGAYFIYAVSCWGGES